MAHVRIETKAYKSQQNRFSYCVYDIFTGALVDIEIW